MRRRWQVLQRDGVATIRFVVRDVAHWRQRALLMSDVHGDHEDCDWELVNTLLDEAREEDAPALLNGDTADVTQSFRDPRRDVQALLTQWHKMHTEENISPRLAYLQVVREYLVAKLKRHSRQLAWIGMGNHDMSPSRYHDFALMEDVLAKLQDDGSPVLGGNYASTLRLEFVRGSKTDVVSIYANHGAGGNAPVTQGAIDHARMMERMHGFDVIWLGHTHDVMVNPRGAWESHAGANGERVTHIVRTPSLIKSAVQGSKWTHQNMLVTRQPRGAAWLEFWYRKGKLHIGVMADVV